jgi:hypothetical protein
VLSGQVDMICDSSTWAPNVEAGQMRALAVWSAERAPRFPAVPTLKELGYDMVVASPYGGSGPKGMDPGIVRVHASETRPAAAGGGMEILVVMEFCPGGHLLARINKQQDSGVPLPYTKVGAQRQVGLSGKGDR